MTNDDFLRDLSDGVKSPDEFRPFLSYHAAGDVIEAFWECGPFVARPLLPGLVVYEDRATGRVIGVLLDGVAAIRSREGIVRGESAAPPAIPPVSSRYRTGDRVRPTDGAHRGVLMEFVAAVDHGPEYPPMARCRVVLHDGSLAVWEANVYLDHLEREP
jgi:hypothetical protein